MRTRKIYLPFLLEISLGFLLCLLSSDASIKKTMNASPLLTTATTFSSKQ